MEKLFENILDKDEKIIKAFKPNKLKLYMSTLFISLVSLGWLIIPLIVTLIENSFDRNKTIIILIAYIGGLLLLFGTIFALTTLYYNKLVYAYSNKRIIIRTGIFGVDYKSLDMSMIGAINVYVSLLDRILKRNTGSIMFGSMASPMFNSNSAGTGYRFANITTPYEVYREIKGATDEYKESKK